jgi:hypothetical protein
MTIVPIKYWIETRRIARRWWFGSKTEYVIRCHCAWIGGFKTREEAHSAARKSGREWAAGLLHQNKTDERQ